MSTQQQQVDKRFHFLPCSVHGVTAWLENRDIIRRLALDRDQSERYGLRLDSSCRGDRILVPDALVKVPQRPGLRREAASVPAATGEGGGRTVPIDRGRER